MICATAATEALSTIMMMTRQYGFMCSGVISRTTRVTNQILDAMRRVVVRFMARDSENCEVAHREICLRKIG
jgi:hypothetical protein